jgi:hypothetical protein
VVEEGANGCARRPTTGVDGQHVADVIQAQTQCAGPADEGQQLDVVAVVDPVTRGGSSSAGQQPFGLIDPYRLAGDASGLRCLPDHQSSSFHDACASSTFIVDLAPRAGF